MDCDRSTTVQTTFDFELSQKKLMKILTETKHANVLNKLESFYNSLQGCEADKRNVMDLAIRSHLTQKLLKSKDQCVLHLQQFVDLAIDASRHEICSATLPIVLLSDTFDAVTIDECERLFSLVEDGVNIWKENLFFLACKNNLLRMCNDLLRRLSRSKNTVFCGRILLFLAKFFPFSERSGLNIISEFNLDNVTLFGMEEETDFEDGTMETDEGLEEGEVSLERETNTSNPNIDYNMYRKFWMLQDFFRNPNQCYTKIPWKTFTSYATDVLWAFGSFKLDNVTSRVSPSKVTNGDEEKDQYFAKYLTNQKLLELQLSDCNFRRFLLLQFLILFQYLNSPVKFKQDTCALTEEQSHWVTATTQKVYKLLGETPPDGEKFASVVKHMLKREEYWSNWKNEGCPAFAKPVPMTVDSSDKDSDENRKRKAKPEKIKLGDAVRDGIVDKRCAFGRPELMQLWNLNPNNLEACKSKQRDFLPSLDSYFQNALDPANRKVEDPNYGWRALRLLARRCPNFFSNNSTGLSTNYVMNVPDYLEGMLKKLAKDIPLNVQVFGDTKQDPVESDTGVSAGGDEDDELLKPDDYKKDEEPMEGADDDVVREKVIPPTEDQLKKLGEKLGSDWTKLAAKLSFREDEILYFQTETQEPAMAMFKIWLEHEEGDANAADLLYILEGLGLQGAAEGIF